MSPSLPTDIDGGVLVCGLGRLGQHCVRVLHRFGVPIHAVEAREGTRWTIPDLPMLLARLVTGDCRLPVVLEEAGIRHARAVLLVTGDDRVNITAALAARTLNPGVRVVLRSQHETLNSLLSRTLGNFAAMEPTRLCVDAFALAGLGEATAGLFDIDDRPVLVQRRVVAADDAWCGRRLEEIETQRRRILAHGPAAARFERFHDWDPEAEVRPGDEVGWVELDRPPAATSVEGEPARAAWRSLLSRESWIGLRRALGRYRREGGRIRRVTLASALLLAALYGTGAVLYKTQYPEVDWHAALNVPMVLLLGGYDNLFGQLELPFAIPVWLQLFSLGLTVAGTIFLGIVYATLTERVLSARFHLGQKRPPLPKADHVVLVGTGRLGREVAALLDRLSQPVILFGDGEPVPEHLAHLPVMRGEVRDRLQDVGLPRARSLMALTGDEVANLEIALLARTIHPGCRVVVRMDEFTLSGGGVAELLPGASVFGIYPLAGEAFAAAAFGENIGGLLHLDETTVLVMEYTVEEGDTLVGRQLGEIAWGYGLFLVVHRRAGVENPDVFPPEYHDARPGDRLLVLATHEAVRRVELGRLLPRTRRVRLEGIALAQDSDFAAAIVLARMSGCEIALARGLTGRLPATLEVPLYPHQASRLVRELQRVGCRARVVDVDTLQTAEA